jgi:hypothetical protein
MTYLDINVLGTDFRLTTCSEAKVERSTHFTNPTHLILLDESWVYNVVLL